MKKLFVCCLSIAFVLLFSGCVFFRQNQEKPLETIKPTATSGTAATNTPESTFQVTETLKPVTTTETPSPQVTPTPDSKNGVKMYVTGEKVNVRADSTTSAQKLASLQWGTEVIAFETKDQWTYICFGTDSYGYIATRYLSTTKPTKPTPEPTFLAPATPDQSGDGSFDLPEDMI